MRALFDTKDQASNGRLYWNEAEAAWSADQPRVERTPQAVQTWRRLMGEGIPSGRPFHQRVHSP